MKTTFPAITTITDGTYRGEVVPLSPYEKQAQAFLSLYGVSLTIKRAADKPPAWAKPGESYGNRYRVTLRRTIRPGGVNAINSAPVSFDFWGSINDKAKGEDPTAYDVLACISSDIYCPETFADFCAEYGYNEDSRTDERTFKRCDAFGRKLRAFFPEGDERDALCEIR